MGIQTEDRGKPNGFFHTGSNKGSTFQSNTRGENKNFIELNKKRNKMVTLSNC